MRKDMAWWSMMLVVIGLSLAASTGARAEEPSAPQQLTRQQRWNGSMRKLGRGVANIATFPLELIREPYLTERKDGYIAAWTVGIVRGFGSGLVRAGAGLYETVTFFLPNGGGYDPIVKPEFVYRYTDWAE